MALIGQEVSAEPWIDVPGDVLDILRLWRPTPLQRAMRLEQALGTPARIYFPFVPDDGVRLVAVEPLSCPTLTQGRFEYDFGDSMGWRHCFRCTPSATTTCPRRFMPAGCATTATRRPSPRWCATVGWRRWPTRRARFDAAVQFAKVEGKIPAPECAHGIRAVIDEALAAKETGEERVILFNYCGHGLLDLSAYDDYLNGRLPDEQG